ncbi:hypothetical protein [Sodaliphilus pleomorphus]|uniref:hypothetical protein n=1 Tax=Sodaliphilus pleomorphus TaxID=2606626 RepID=UPI0024093EC3|nr:hypothetical protein [Sodaliphilus pleomorphus]
MCGLSPCGGTATSNEIETLIDCYSTAAGLSSVRPGGRCLFSLSAYSLPRGLKAGGKYQVFVVDDNADPIVLEAGEMPTFDGSTQTAEYCGTKWYNFMYEADGTPSTDKLQLYMQGDSTKQYDEPLGKPIGFGECTDWESLHVTKTVYNSQGYQSRYYTFHVIDGTTGEDKGQLEYVSNTAGRVKAFTDYWTWYIGRQYRLYVHGVRTSKTVRVAVSRWTAY